MNRSIGSYPRVVAYVLDPPTPCDYWRLVVPFKHLAAAGYPVAVLPFSVADKVLLREVDVVVVSRWGVPSREAMTDTLRTFHRDHVALVWDTDDDLLHIPSDRTDWHPELQEGLLWALRQADEVTVTTPHLAAQMSSENPQVSVLPNLIDPDDWTFRGGRPRVVPGLTIGVHGGLTHQDDWRVLHKLFAVLADRYPQVTFVVAGYAPPYLDEIGLGDRLIKLAWAPISQYQDSVACIDIALCPLPDTLFNRSKSPIKWIESAICGVPVVASPTVYSSVIRHGVTGFIAETIDEWVSYTSALIEDADERRRIGRAAQKAVLRSHSIHDATSLRQRIETYRTAWERTFGMRFEPQASTVGTRPSLALRR